MGVLNVFSPRGLLAWQFADHPREVFSEGAHGLQSFGVAQGLTGGSGEEDYLASVDTEAFAAAASLFLGRRIGERAESAPLMRIEV